MLRLKSLKLLSLTVGALLLFGLVITGLPTQAAQAAGISITPTSGWVTQTFWVTAGGFQPGEQVSTWVTRPDGVSVATGSFNANASGVVTWSIKPASNWPGGGYRAVVHGKSGLEQYVDFQVNGAPTPTPVKTPTPVVSLPSIEGRTFFYTGTHYKPGELVWVWYTPQNSPSVYLTKVYADPWGNVLFPITMGTNWPFGGYTYAAKGLTSSHLTWMTLSYFDYKITDVKASDPAVGRPFVFTFVATGFYAGENVSIWMNLPNGTTRYLAAVKSDGNGTASYTMIVPPGLPSGRYRMVAYGGSSHRTFYHDYDYSNPGN